MKVLYITNMYPNAPNPYSGIFVKREVEYLRKEGLEVEVIFINGQKNKFEYIKAPFIIFDRLSKRKFDVINVQHSLLLPQTLLARKLLRLRTPIIYTFHEGETSNRYARTNVVKALLTSGRWKSFFARHVDLVIATNLEVMENNMNLPKTLPLVELPPSVDVSAFSPLDKAKYRKRLGFDTGKFLVFFPADPQRPEKNFSFLKQVIEDLNARGTQELEIITGPISPETMSFYYNACDIVCLPSLYEAAPIVVKEAMACNRPIVASDVGDIGKTIGNVDGCFVVRDWNKNDFGKCILKALQYESTNGRERISEMGWDSETSTKKLLSALNQLTHSVKPGGQKDQ
ncbi:MAG: glycosyltransferase family 4 protein [Dehalococcoidia bacterium]